MEREGESSKGPREPNGWCQMGLDIGKRDDVVFLKHSESQTWLWQEKVNLTFYNLEKLICLFIRTILEGWIIAASSPLYRWVHKAGGSR